MAHEGMWTKLRDLAMGAPGAAIATGGLALANRMFSLSGIYKRLDKQDERLEKGDERMTDIHAELKYQGLVLRAVAANQGIVVPEPQSSKGGV